MVMLVLVVELLHRNGGSPAHDVVIPAEDETPKICVHSKWIILRTQIRLEFGKSRSSTGP